MDFSQVLDPGAAANALDPTPLSAELSALLGSFSANLAPIYRTCLARLF